MDLNEKVIAIILENAEKQIEVNEKTNLREELNLDSFGAMMIINALEDEYNISIEESAFDNFVTVKDIVDFLKEKYNVN